MTLNPEESVDYSKYNGFQRYIRSYIQLENDINEDKPRAVNGYVYQQRPISNDFLKGLAKPFKNNEYMILMPKKRLKIDFDLKGIATLERLLKDCNITAELDRDSFTLKNDNSLIMLKNRRYQNENYEFLAFDNTKETSVIVQRLLNSYIWADSDMVIAKKLEKFKAKMEINKADNTIDLVSKEGYNYTPNRIPLRDNSHIIKLSINNSTFDNFNLLTDLVFLQELDLSGNMLKSISDNISNLVYLKKLDVSDNNLVNLPESLKNLCLDTLIISPGLAKVAGVRSNSKTRILVNAEYNHKEILMPLEEYNFLTGIRPLNEYTEESNDKSLLREIAELFRKRDDKSDKTLYSLKFEKKDGIDRITELKVLNSNLNEKLFCVHYVKMLKNLVLKNCGLTLMPDLSDLSHLVSLDLSNNNLSGEVIMPLISDIETINLSNNKITSISNPDEFKFSYNKLCLLNLANNEIEYIDDTGLLKKLETLNLSGNKIDVSYLTSLSNLKNLSINDNDLSFLDERIAKLTSLETLDLTSNNLNHLPESVVDLSNLKTILLYNNNINYLPRTMIHMGGLRLVNIDYSLLNDPVISKLKSLNSDLKVIDSRRLNQLQSISHDRI